MSIRASAGAAAHLDSAAIRASPSGRRSPKWSWVFRESRRWCTRRPAGRRSPPGRRGRAALPLLRGAGPGRVLVRACALIAALVARAGIAARARHTARASRSGARGTVRARSSGARGAVRARRSGASGVGRRRALARLDVDLQRLRLAVDHLVRRAHVAARLDLLRRRGLPVDRDRGRVAELEVHVAIAGTDLQGIRGSLEDLAADIAGLRPGLLVFLVKRLVRVRLGLLVLQRLLLRALSLLLCLLGELLRLLLGLLGLRLLALRLGLRFRERLLRGSHFLLRLLRLGLLFVRLLLRVGRLLERGRCLGLGLRGLTGALALAATHVRAGGEREGGDERQPPRFHCWSSKDVFPPRHATWTPGGPFAGRPRLFSSPRSPG